LEQQDSVASVLEELVTTTSKSHTRRDDENAPPWLSRFRKREASTGSQTDMLTMSMTRTTSSIGSQVDLYPTPMFPASSTQTAGPSLMMAQHATQANMGSQTDIAVSHTDIAVSRTGSEAVSRSGSEEKDPNSYIRTITSGCLPGFKESKTNSRGTWTTRVKVQTPPYRRPIVVVGSCSVLLHVSTGRWTLRLELRQSVKCSAILTSWRLVIILEFLLHVISTVQVTSRSYGNVFCIVLMIHVVCE
jgi:hypothetical protein